MGDLKKLKYGGGPKIRTKLSVVNSDKFKNFFRENVPSNEYELKKSHELKGRYENFKKE
jgi:hypothetical protein